MDKILLTACLALPALAMANNPTEQETRPIIVLTTVSDNNGEFIPLNSTTTHQSKNDEHICWVTNNLPVQANRQVAELFTGPDPFVMGDSTPNIKITHAANQALIEWVATEADSGYYRCYHFGTSDPAGDYSLQVQIGDVIFDPVSFKVVP